MFRVSRFLLAPVKVKQTTGLVGFPVQPRWREMILKLCDDGLKLLEQHNIPKGTFFRTSNENNFKYFQQVVKSTDDYEVVEDTLNRGQVEEIIVLLEDQLDLIPKMAEWRAWEVDADDVKLEKDDAETLEYDCDIPKDHVPPKMKFLTWDGIYQTEYTPEEVKQMSEAAKQQQQ
ncbi:hypothetical protein C9374_004297 [Naegleria lovaniensis]|uniref:Uncharacterized protein n=1 Tax=Naegleria lovaniensis TaxID=51637 RepID=A0AA88GMA2_NAELO|nr:uncharacterized protein C9374_004297 [Naegleria lovaniensis]KAG2383626.1 hypothetical protein C9374_004297 [Naegleria lovaniensis]